MTNLPKRRLNGRRLVPEEGDGEDQPESEEELISESEEDLA
jgi:hypothetical protein